MADSAPRNRDSLVEALRKSKPAALRCVLVDGSEKEVAIPGKRKRWAQVRTVLDRLAWVRLECLDPKGRTLDIIDNDEQAEDLEELDGYGGQVHQLTALMLRAQDVALRRNAELHRQSNDMVLRLCEVLMERLIALEKGFGANLRMAQRFAATAAEGSSGDGLMSTELIEAVMPELLMKMLKSGEKPGNSDATKK